MAFKFDKETGKTALRSVEVGGAAFGLGFLHGRKGNMPEKFGVPLDLGAAIGLHLLAFSGYTKGAAQHLHALGDGALAYYFGSLGGQYGQKKRKAAGELTGASNPRTITAGWQPQQMGNGAVPASQAAWAPTGQNAYGYPKG